MRWPHRDRMVGLLVMVLSLVAIGVSMLAGWRNHEYARCQAKVNDALVAAQVARDAASAQDRDAVDRMVVDVLKARTSADTRVALERYRDTRAGADADRAANPLPAPPSQTCG